MIICAAQTVPKRGNIDKNIEDHLRLTAFAADYGAQLIAFPEMSLTGYERENAGKLSFTEADTRLDELKKMAHDKEIIIIAGAPVKIGPELYIASFILFPDRSVKIYTKQFLHAGEENFFASSFDYNPILKLENEVISLAVCYDIENTEHILNAARAGSTIYIASIFYTLQGINNAHGLLSRNSKRYSMNILMSNCGGESWGLDAGGESAFWSAKGELTSKIDGTGEGLLIVEKQKDCWISKTV